MPATVCPRCGATFACGAATGSCWCADVSLAAAAVAAARAAGDTCLCPACLAELAGDPVFGPPGAV